MYKNRRQGVKNENRILIGIIEIIKRTNYFLRKSETMVKTMGKITYLNFIVTRIIRIWIKSLSRQTIITIPKSKEENNTKHQWVTNAETVEIEKHRNIWI